MRSRNGRSWCLHARAGRRGRRCWRPALRRAGSTGHMLCVGSGELRAADPGRLPHVGKTAGVPIETDTYQFTVD